MTWPDSKLIYQPQDIQVATHQVFTAEMTFFRGIEQLKNQQLNYLLRHYYSHGRQRF